MCVVQPQLQLDISGAPGQFYMGSSPSLPMSSSSSQPSSLTTSSLTSGSGHPTRRGSGCGGRTEQLGYLIDCYEAIIMEEAKVQGVFALLSLYLMLSALRTAALMILWDGDF